MAEGRYYWLKLKSDFFKRHDMKVIKAMQNGKDYLLFYLNLLLESLDHNGRLRFSDTIPYNEEMLAAVTDTNVDVVRQAIRIFCELNLIEIFDDGTFYMKEIERYVGSESVWAEKKRISRSQSDDVKALPESTVGTMSGQCPDNVQQSIEYRDKSIDTSPYNPPLGDATTEAAPQVEKPKSGKRKRKQPEYIDDVTASAKITEWTSSKTMHDAVMEFVAYRREGREPMTELALKKTLTELDKLGSTDEEKMAILNQSILAGYRGVFEVRSKKKEVGSGNDPYYPKL